eukprot:6208239-Prorocentrum_lima.AAC.1
MLSTPPTYAEHFGLTLREGTFLCWDPKTIQGARVAVVQPSGDVSIVAASAPVPWPDEACEGIL